MRPTRATALLLTTLLVPAAACLPGTGEVKILGDGVYALADTAGSPDSGTQEDGTPPAPDTGPAPDGGTTADLAPATPDAAPTGPQPPFGSSVGMTAKNFEDIPDCDGKLYSLYDYYNKKQGVLIAMMSPS